MKIQNILVPLDFSEFSIMALEYAINLAEKYSSQITLMHAVVLFQDDINEEERLQMYEDMIRKREENIRKYIINSQNNIEKRGITVKSEIIRGISAADTILEFIDKLPTDIVIMGTHGKSGLKHLFQGSVAEKVVRLSPVPVLTVHRSTQNFRIKRLLVPIDFSLHSKKAIDYAVSLADTFKAYIDFVHVIEQEIHPSFYASGIYSISQIDKDLKNRVIENMKAFVEDQLNPNIKTDYIVCEGKSHKEIINLSKEEKTDLIVIATHGLTGLDYILLGSTTEKVVRWANSPVLTIKSMLQNNR
jgi:nucleotide-binding universal stress UspA family protein